MTTANLRDAASVLKSSATVNVTADANDDSDHIANAVLMGCPGWCTVAASIGAVSGTTPRLTISIYQSNTGLTGDFEKVGALGLSDDSADSTELLSTVYIDKPYVSYGYEVGGTTPDFEVNEISLQPEHIDRPQSGASTTRQSARP